MKDRDTIDKYLIIELRDAVFSKNVFSYKEKSIPNASKVFKRKEIVEIKELKHRISKREKKTSYNLWNYFCLYLVKGDRNEITNSVILLDIDKDPKTFKKAMCSRDVLFWKQTISNKMDSIMTNQTWKLVNLRPSCQPLRCKWIFKKIRVSKSIQKFKTRLVAKGFK